MSSFHPPLSNIVHSNNLLSLYQSRWQNILLPGEVLSNAIYVQDYILLANFLVMALIPFLLLSLLNFLFTGPSPGEVLSNAIYVWDYILLANFLVMALIRFLLLSLLNFLLYRTITR